jgi:hypothetical protein
MSTEGGNSLTHEGLEQSRVRVNQRHSDWQGLNGRRTISSVTRRAEWLLASGLAILAVGLTTIPYLLANEAVAGKAVFGGFLIHPLDGFSYLAKMRQGLQGAWEFHLPYAAEPGEGAFAFVYMLLLGHLARLFGAPLLTVFHGARVVASLAMFLTAFGFYESVLPERGQRWVAFVLTLFGSGVGWLGIPSGLFGTDLWMPESIPFLSAYANAHFPLASACVLGAALAVSKSDSPVVPRSLVCLVCGFTLAAVLPFVVLSTAAFLIVWNAWEIWRAGAITSWTRLWQEHRGALLPTGGYIAAAGPWLIYDFWLTRTQPVLAVWNAQNQTPSPPPFDYLLGFGMVLLLAVVGTVLARPDGERTGRLLLTWVIVTAILLYAPINVQRRLSHGLFFPLAALAALGLEAIGRRWRLFGPAVVMTMVLSVPSNLMVVLAGLDSVSRLEPRIVLSEEEANAYRWAADHIAGGSLILAGEIAGNRLPAFADVRVVYGHPFETPDATSEREWMEEMYSWTGEESAALDQLRVRHVAYVYFGPEERHIGKPTWLSELTVVFIQGDVQIRQVTLP